MNAGHTYSCCKHYWRKKQITERQFYYAVCSNQLSWLAENDCRLKKAAIFQF